MERIDNLWVVLGKGEALCPECCGEGKTEQELCPVCKGARILERKEGQERQEAYYKEGIRLGNLLTNGLVVFAAIAALVTFVFVIVRIYTSFYS